MSRTQGVPAKDLSDEELERQGTYAHATRTWALLHGTADQFEHHTERMLELEREYLRRHPKRAWQRAAGGAVDGAVDAPRSGSDELTHLKLSLNGLIDQIRALLADAGHSEFGAGEGEASPPAAGGDDTRELLRKFADSSDGCMHKLEARQVARALGVSPARLADLYKADPPLLRADGEARCLTEEGRSLLGSSES